MTEQEEATDWRKLREFAEVYLDQSFVLSWSVESESLLIDVDLLLAQNHPFYEPPRPAEGACIRPAIIEFPYCDSIATKRSSTTENLSTIVDTLQHGRIRGLRRLSGGRYEIEGDFGSVLITAERPILRLKGP